MCKNLKYIGGGNEARFSAITLKLVARSLSKLLLLELGNLNILRISTFHCIYWLATLEQRTASFLAKSL